MALNHVLAHVLTWGIFAKVMSLWLWTWVFFGHEIMSEPQISSYSQICLPNITKAYLSVKCCYLNNVTCVKYIAKKA